MDNDKSTIGAWVGAALALAYIVSPLDVIPDAFPAVGWLDDFLAALIAILNLIQSYIGNISTSLVSLVKLIKWVIIVIGVLILVILALVATLIIKS